MIPSQFYPTVTQINANTNTIELTDNLQSINDFTANGLSAYYLGYLNSDNIPYYLNAYIDETSGDNVKLTKVIPDVNPDFAYINQAQNNLDYYSCFLSAYTTQTPFNFSYAYNAINSISPLNTRCASPPQSIVLTYSYLTRKWTDPTNPSDIYFYTEYRNINISDMVNFLNGSGTLQFGIALGDGHYEYPNLNINDFDYHNAFTNVYEYSGTYYDTTLMINACGVSQPMFCENNGTATVGGRNSIYPTIHQKIDGVDYIVNAGGARTNGIFNIVNNNSVITIDGKVDYNNYSFFTTSLDFNLSDVGTNFLRLAGENSFVYSNATNSYKVFVAMGWKDIAFSLALLPCLNSTDLVNNCYYPEIIENELTGNFFKYSDLSTYGTDWQKSGEIADDEYTEDDKPSPSDDGEDDTRKRNDVTNLPEIGGIRLVSGTGFSSFYLLSAYHVSELGQLLSQMPSTFWEALGTATDYKMSNILDYISALKWYPINIAASAPALYPDVQVSDIQFGFNGSAKVILNEAGTSYRLGTVNRVFDMGSIDIPYRAAQQTFLDLEPYTDVYANLPYIGKVQLQANQVLGYTITCYYIIDLITGIATCFMDNGYDTIYTGSGKIGVDISVAGNDIITQSERMSAAYVGTVTHAVSNALSIGGNVATSNPAGAIVGTGDMISGLVADSIAAANAKRGVPQVVGGGSGFGSTYACQSPAIIVQRPAVKIPGGYGHSIGYIYNTRVTISNLSGFTVCDNPDLSGIPATSAEVDMIRSILTSGFYA